MNDLERLQRENEALTLALRAQQEINHYKEIFLARVAHELRSPLSSVIGLHQIILQGLCESPAEEKVFLNDANAAAHRLLDLLEDIVTVAKLDYGRIELDRHPIALAELILSLEPEISLPTGNANFKRVFTVADNLPDIHGDRAKLLWVLRNLMDRSVQASPQKSGVIHLEAAVSQAGDRVELTLKLPVSTDIWSLPTTPDTLTAIDSPPPLQKINQGFVFSPPLTWQLAQTLIQKMDATIAMDDGNPSASNPCETIVRLSFPLSQR